MPYITGVAFMARDQVCIPGSKADRLRRPLQAGERIDEQILVQAPGILEEVDMNSHLAFRRLFLIESLFVALGTQAYGQGTQSTVLGSVTDSSRRTVPGATITVKNQGTGIEEDFTRTKI